MFARDYFLKTSGPPGSRCQMYRYDPRKKPGRGLCLRPGNSWPGNSLRVYNLKVIQYMEPCLQSGLPWLGVSFAIWTSSFSALSLLLSNKL